MTRLTRYAAVVAVTIGVSTVAASLVVLNWQRTLIEQSRVLAHFGRTDTGEWRGYLIVPRRDRYRLVAPADGDVWVEVQGQPVIDAGMARHEAWVELDRGLRPIRIHHVSSPGARALDFRWARGNATPCRIPPVLFVPDLVSHEEVRRRATIARVAPLALPACSLMLLALAVVAGRAVLRRLFAASTRSALGPPILWVAVVAVFATGIWWGLPDDTGWAVDEITPGEVAEAVEARFSGGWATRYPPLHYGVLTALTAPFHVAAGLGVVDIADIRVATQMFLIARGLSVLMAVAIVVVVFGLAREIADHRAALFAAATIAAALPLTYYAKTINLDVPSVFWLMLSLVFYTRAFAHRRPADFYLFTAAGVAAICTKDQTYGYFVLPAAYMAVGAVIFRRAPRPGMPPVRVLAAMAAIAIGGLMLFYNVPFNPSGFAEHVRIITGPASENYRMYPGTPSGQVRLLGTAVRELGQAMGWPLFAASVCGIIAAFRARVTPIQWLMVPLASYYLTLVAVVGYHYDRFFLGTIGVLAVAAGWWIDRWTRDGVPWRTLRTIAVAIAVVYGVGRVLALDAMMVKDARYDVETWLIEHAGPHDRIAALGFRNYLPRASKIFWRPLDESLEALEAAKPDFVIVNVAFSRRSEPGSEQHDLYDALSSGAAGYGRVLRYRTRLSWSPLNWEPRFDGEREDEFSNLTKINPTIDVFRRRPDRSR